MIPEDVYNALAAARKYVCRARDAAKALVEIMPGERSEARLAEVEADLAKDRRSSRPGRSAQ